jgi:hypothetical protein
MFTFCEKSQQCKKTSYSSFRLYTANEGPVRIQYKCLVPIYVFPEMKLCVLLISKTKLQYSLSQFHIHVHVSVSDLYIPSIDRYAYFAAAK